MVRKIVNDATDEELKNFALYVFDELKDMDDDIYEETEEKLYKMVYGEHFNQWSLEKALYCMENEDGTKGEHWSLDQTTQVATQSGITFDKFNKYDWCYTMNMIYSDYYGSIPNELNYYVKLSTKFLNDKDAKEGKAYRYYIKMKN